MVDYETFSLPPLIGLSGKAGSGKDTVADYLARVYGYSPFAFADLLKEVVGLAFNFSAEQLFGDLKDEEDPRWRLTPRWCLQHFGSAFRAVREDIWIRGLLETVQEFWQSNGQRPVVISDVRLRNEAQAVKERGGVLWRLQGRNLEISGIIDHASEKEMDGWGGFDQIVDNSGSLAQLFAQIDLLLSQ